MEKWIIHSNVFEDNEKNNLILVVVNDIIDEFERLIPDGPPKGKKPIEILNDFVSGPTLFWLKGDNNYKIALNIAEVNYHQIAFQFTQELCRIYCDPQENSWIIQLFCHIAALYILDFLRIKWEKTPPSNDLKDYWYNFDTYKSNLLSAAFSRVDIVKYQVDNDWLKYQIDKLRSNEKIHRGKLLIMAYELLTLFEENPESWLLLPFIGKSMIQQPTTNEMGSVREKEPDFEKLLQLIPEKIKPFTLKFFNKIGVGAYI